MTHKSEVRESVAADGRRVQERVTRTTLDDGSLQEVHEHLEEVVPMETKKRITKRFAQVPIEVKTEVFEGDSVETSIKSLSDSDLELHDCSAHGFDTTFGRSLDCGCPSPEVALVKDSCHHHGKSFMGKATAKYGKKKHCHHHSMEAIPVERSGIMEQAVASLLWVTFAVVTGLVVFSVI